MQTVTATVSNAAGDVAEPATRTITHTLTEPAISIDVVAGDDVINTVEDNSDVTISGTTVGVEDGQTVTLELNGKTYTASVVGGVWSLAVPVVDAELLDSTELVSVSVSNLAGDMASATREISHTVEPPVEPIDEGRIETGLRGSGSISWFVLFIGLLLTLVKGRKMPPVQNARLFDERVFYLLKPVMLLLGFIFTSTAQATPRQCDNNSYIDDLPEGTQIYDCSGFYAGIGLGLSNIKPRIVNLPEEHDQTSDMVLPTLFLGYDLNAQWSLEAHYSNQGEATFKSGAAIDYSHMGASVLYHLGTHLPGWHAYGKLGVSKLETELGKSRDDNGVFGFNQLESTQIHLGAGIEYMTRNLWGARLEALSVDKDSREITLSVLKRFGRDEGKVKAKMLPPPPPPPVEPPPPPPPEEICNAPYGVLQGVYFITDSASITVESQYVLDKIVMQLAPFPNIELAVKAHTDSRGSDSYNLNLSERRATSVREYLQYRGIQNIISKGYGETRPIADNETAEGRAQNRRVELEVLSDECEGVNK